MIPMAVLPTSESRQETSSKRADPKDHAHSLDPCTDRQALTVRSYHKPTYRPEKRLNLTEENPPPHTPNKGGFEDGGPQGNSMPPKTVP